MVVFEVVEDPSAQWIRWWDVRFGNEGGRWGWDGRRVAERRRLDFKTLIRFVGCIQNLPTGFFNIHRFYQE